MQIQISFTSDEDIILPIHYNNILQAFIYNNIDVELADFLHNEGFIVNNRRFKLFAFSRILKRGNKVGRSFNFGNSIEFLVASPLGKFCKSIANSMLQKEDLFLGKNNIKTDQIQIFNPQVEGDEIIVETISGIVAYSTLLKVDDNKYTHYYTPEERDFERIVAENLIKKYNALIGQDFQSDGNLKIIPIGNSKQSISYYKDFIIKPVDGKFKIRGDKRLLQIGLDTGFGSKNSQGYGCVRII
ncbi:MAG: CRISPR-associated endoribonuclease Cas6 [Tissierellaceae bacterium]|nr:CRISPR-associated endoribonuclease Cas6 [Tissierellaceae bacterium]